MPVGKKRMLDGLISTHWFNVFAESRVEIIQFENKNSKLHSEIGRLNNP
jgi:hypothetical protein